MATKLIGQEGADQGKTLNLSDGEKWVIGRDPSGCDLVIEDPEASEKHLIFHQTPAGILLENLSDDNPAQVNGESIEESILLQEGDQIKMGGSIFRFTADELEEEEELADDFSDDLVDEEGVEEEEAAEEELPPPDEQEPEKVSHKEPLPKQDLEEEEEREHETIFDVNGDESSNRDLADINFNLFDAGRWLLKVVSGPNSGAEFSMPEAAEYLIGTDVAQCDIVFQDHSVSRTHAKLILADDETISIEDVSSRNGVFVDGEQITERTALSTNTLITLGTTTFVVLDREGESETIVSPPLSTFGKVVQSPETVVASQAAVQGVPEKESHKRVEDQPVIKRERSEPGYNSFSALILLAFVTGLFVIIGLGIGSLFKEEKVVEEKVNKIAAIEEAMERFPSVKWTFNEKSGQLLLLGHVITTIEYSQIAYAIQDLPFVKDLDNNVVIDELVSQEINKVLAKSASWRTASIYSPEAGKFLLNAYLQTNQEAQGLNEYIAIHFPYPELLERKVIVEEDIINQIGSLFIEKGFLDVTEEINKGEVTLTGTMSRTKRGEFDEIVGKIEKILGITSVKSYVIELAEEEAVIDLSGQYEVTGSTNIGSLFTTVVINGKILAEGDKLDGMSIKEIKKDLILLEKDGFKYKIEYNK